ncbi:MAG: DUF4900 domain-containing protein [Actinobacteria bacterium]|nr:DUF4900 domain-containing protein [Actinomycetota bacterium]
MDKVVSLILFGLIVSTMSLRLQARRSVVDSVINVTDKYNEEMARNVANGGANIALNALTLDVTSTQSADDVSLYNGQYSYYIERQAQDATLGPTQVRVTSIGTFHNDTHTVVVLLTRPSFSRYAYFSNHEGNIWFWSGDTLRGPVHTNTYFQMGGTPVFFGKVTSHQIYNSYHPYREYPYGSTNPRFLGGTEWQVPALTMPSEIPPELISDAQNGGIYINNRYAWLKFQSNGTVKIASKNSSSNPPSGAYTTYNLSNTNGVIYVHYNSNRPVVKVKGTVNGRVTVATRGSIKVIDDLVYADNPQTNPNSDDMIGLAAARNIIVTNNQHDQDRTIQATVMTMNPSTSYNKNFWVYHYNTDRYGTLHLYGGLIQQSRGAVGLTGSSYSRKGYLKDYRWDSRLRNMVPPSFPMLFVLRKIAWWD